jgi:hypothetical protein
MCGIEALFASRRGEYFPRIKTAMGRHALEGMHPNACRGYDLRPTNFLGRLLIESLAGSVEKVSRILLELWAGVGILTIGG